MATRARKRAAAASDQPSKRRSPTSIDTQDMPEEVREGNALAAKVMARWGKPTMTLEELRAALDKELGDFSLGEFIIREREAGW